MCKGLAHMVWWYFHPRTVLNFTDGVSGINHSLAGSELYLLLYLAVSSALYILPSVCESMSLNSLSCKAPPTILSTLHPRPRGLYRPGMPRYIVLPLLLTLTPRRCPPR